MAGAEGDILVHEQGSMPSRAREAYGDQDVARPGSRRVLLLAAKTIHAQEMGDTVSDDTFEDMVVQGLAEDYQQIIFLCIETQRAITRTSRARYGICFRMACHAEAASRQGGWTRRSHANGKARPRQRHREYTTLLKERGSLSVFIRGSMKTTSTDPGAWVGGR